MHHNAHCTVAAAARSALALAPAAATSTARQLQAGRYNARGAAATNRAPQRARRGSHNSAPQRALHSNYQQRASTGACYDLVATSSLSNDLVATTS